MKVKVAQLCPTLCDTMDNTVHGILQARILEWVAFPFSRGSAQPSDRTQVSPIAGGFFTNWANREAQGRNNSNSTKTLPENLSKKPFSVWGQHYLGLTKKNGNYRSVSLMVIDSNFLNRISANQIQQYILKVTYHGLLLLLQSRFSRVRLCATP